MDPISMPMDSFAITSEILTYLLVKIFLSSDVLDCVFLSDDWQCRIWTEAHLLHLIIMSFL